MFLRAMLCFTTWLLAPTHTSRTDARAIAWTADLNASNSLLAVGNDQGHITIYNTSNWQKIKQLHYPFTTITRLEWNPKHNILAITGVATQRTKPFVQLYNANTGHTIAFLPANIQGRGLSWKPDGEQIAFTGSEGAIHIYSNAGKLVKILSVRNQGSFFDIDWHPVKNILLAVEEDIYLIDIDQDKLLGKFDDGSVNKGILSAQWHPGGQIFATGDYGHEQDPHSEPSYIRIWDHHGKPLKRIYAGKSEYRNLRWSPDGKWLAAASDGVYLVDTSGKQYQHITNNSENVWGIQWYQNGKQIASSDQSGAVWVNEVGRTGKLRINPSMNKGTKK